MRMVFKQYKNKEATTEKFFLELAASVIYIENRPATFWACAARRIQRVSDA